MRERLALHAKAVVLHCHHELVDGHTALPEAGRDIAQLAICQLEPSQALTWYSWTEGGYRQTGHYIPPLSNHSHPAVHMNI